MADPRSVRLSAAAGEPGAERAFRDGYLNWMAMLRMLVSEMFVSIPACCPVHARYETRRAASQGE